MTPRRPVRRVLRRERLGRVNRRRRCRHRLGVRRLARGRDRDSAAWAGRGCPVRPGALRCVERRAERDQSHPLRRTRPRRRRL